MHDAFRMVSHKLCAGLRAMTRHPSPKELEAGQLAVTIHQKYWGLRIEQYLNENRPGYISPLKFFYYKIWLPKPLRKPSKSVIYFLLPVITLE